MSNPWKFTDASNSIIGRVADNGGYESRLASTLTPEELAQVLPADPVSPNTAIYAQIDFLERAAMMPRGTREYMLSELESKAVALGAAMVPPLDAASSLAAAYAGNILYRKLKDLDDQIALLRAQLV